MFNVSELKTKLLLRTQCWVLEYSKTRTGSFSALKNKKTKVSKNQTCNV